MGGVAAVMLLAGGDTPAEALGGLQRLTIVARALQYHRKLPILYSVHLSHITIAGPRLAHAEVVVVRRVDHGRASRV